MRYPLLGIFFAWFYYYGQQNVMCYKIPQVKLEVLQNGFRVSIPHETGVEEVAYNINRNRPFKAFEPGETSIRVRVPSADNLWSYESKLPVQDGDIIYVWTDVQYRKSRFRSMATPILANGTAVASEPRKVNNENKATTTEPTVVTTVDQSSTTSSTCEPSRTITSNRNTFCKGQLIFEENFDGNRLDMTRWRYEVRLPLDIADAEFVLYDTNAEVLNGLLKIEPQLWGNDSPNADIRRGQLNLGARCTAHQNPEVECQRQAFGRVVLPPVLTARINTKHAFSFKYGRVEVRAKLPKGDWLYPLLLLEPLVNYYGQQPYASGQMRIAFLRSNIDLQTHDGKDIGGRVVYGGAVLRPESIYRDIFMVNTSRSTHFGDAFHTYALTWNERSLSLDVDGQNYGTMEGGFAQYPNGNDNAWAAGSFMAPLDQEFFITLGVAAGGLGDFPDTCISKPWTNTSPKAALNFWRDRNNWKTTWTSPALEVDYVRVYAVYERGISSVIFNIEINQQCPVIFDLITAPRGELWISEQLTKKLSTNDEVLINVVLQHEDGLFSRTDKAQLSYDNNLVTYQSVKVPDSQVDVCNANTWHENSPTADGRSISKIYINGYLSRKLYKPKDLIFEENFDTKLDTKIWNYDRFMYSNAIGDMSEEFTMFTDDKDNIAVKAGELLITPTMSQRRAKGAYNITGCKGATCYEGHLGTCNYKKERNRHYMYPAPVDSARITTNGTFSFTYGRVEISARLPEGDWLIPYIMLQPDKLNCSMRKQLRIAYATSKDLENSRIRGGPVILYARTNPSNQRTIFERTSHMTFHTGIQANKYHNFTLIWTSTQIALYVDKDKYGCIANNHQYDESYNIVLGVSAGGHLEYTDTYTKPWSNGYNNASQAFHGSFRGCCSKGLGDCTEEVTCIGKTTCSQKEPRYVQKKCSKPWGPQSTMAVNYVRIYAV